MRTFDIAIVGAGGAGLTAAIYAARAGRSVAVFERLGAGGEIATAVHVENYPGFPDGVNGFELGQHMEAQARQFGAEMIYDEVTALARADDGPFRLSTADEYSARAVVVAAGASYRKLGVPGEAEFLGHGVSYCATCDGAFFKSEDVVVVGGGDSAVDEALFLSRLVRSVRIVHRRAELRASAVLQQRAARAENITYSWDSVVERIDGDSAVRSVTIRNLVSGEETVLPAAAVFVFIGQEPNHLLLDGLIPLDESGRAIVDLEMQTAVPGLFVAGDLRTRAARQLVTACGDGATAAIAANRYLDS